MSWKADEARQDWETPAWLFDEFDDEFSFTLDACASETNAKCARCFTQADDALRQRWEGVVWMNPPYGREIVAFMRKARAEADLGATVVCLVPARVDTKWWNETTHRSEVRFRRGRVNFVGGHAAFPGPIAAVVMRPDDPARNPLPLGGWRRMRRA